MTEPTIHEKRCPTCGETKPLDAFSKDRTTGDGLSHRCRDCNKARHRKRRDALRPLPTYPDLPGEIWRPVFGFEGEYSVSNLGRVRRKRRARRTFPGRPLKLYLGNVGYYTVSLRGVTTLVHRLVAEAFLEPEKRHLDVNHKNGVRTDNRVENLEFVTHTENMMHAKNVLRRNMWGRLTEADVRAIRKWHARGGVMYKTIGEHYSLHPIHVSRIVKHRVWKHIE